MIHLARSHHIALDAPPQEVFPLFTPAGTRVEVTCTFTALTEAGNAFLAQFSDDAFRAMIEGWKALLENWLRRRG